MLQSLFTSTHAGAGSWKATTSDNGNGTYAVSFKVDRAGPWVILPKCAAPQCGAADCLASHVHQACVHKGLLLQCLSQCLQ